MTTTNTPSLVSKKIFSLIYFDQPIGSFALTKMNASEIIQIMSTNPLKYDPKTATTNDGYQRELSDTRVKEIADYASSDPDACFPTAVILALVKKLDVAEDNNSIDSPWEVIQNADDPSSSSLVLDLTVKDYALIVDGQHRLFGLKKAGQCVFEKFDIPVVFLFNATLEQLATIFSIINGKQTKVSYSLIAQLFAFVPTRSEEKIAQTFSSALNARLDSPFNSKVKMLGKRIGANESLAQGTMVREFTKMLKPGGAFSSYFTSGDDRFPLKILINFFSAAKETWPNEWDDPDHFILTKTVGFTALIRALPKLYEIGSNQKDLSQTFFKNIFDNMATTLNRENLSLTAEFFPSSGAGANKLKTILVNSAISST